MSNSVISRVAENNSALGGADVKDLVSQACPAKDYRDKKVLLIVPDATRTAPVDLVFKALHEQIASATRAFDVMIALGTHPPMSEEAMCERLGISLDERRENYRTVHPIN